MIKKLSIRNYTLIDELNIEFNSGFSVITGETGAGKSIILGALSLILGQRADLKSLKRTDEKSVIEGLFDISSYHLQSFFEENELDYDAKECILRREILPSGKSRAFINDTPVSVTQLKSSIYILSIRIFCWPILIFSYVSSIRWPEILVYCPIINGSIVCGVNY